MSYDDPDWSQRTLGPRAIGSVKERRSLIWNDGNPTPPAPPPGIHVGLASRGKFFTRGCRGKIEQIQIYCVRTAAGTLDLAFSPHPCLGPLYTVTITPGAAWAWAGVNFRQMWNYDGLFIWVDRCDADVSWGYDAVLPYDAHLTIDAEVTWLSQVFRPYIRILMHGETPGDVPVSGTLNNIPIPNMSSHHVVDNMDIPLGVLTLVTTVNGAGFVDLIIARVIEEANSHLTGFEVHCDGNVAFSWGFEPMNGWGFNDDTQPMSLPAYLVDGFCTMMITKKFEFRRLFQLYAWNNFAAVRVYTRVYPNLMR